MGKVPADVSQASLANDSHSFTQGINRHAQGFDPHLSDQRHNAATGSTVQAASSRPDVTMEFSKAASDTGKTRQNITLIEEGNGASQYPGFLRGFVAWAAAILIISVIALTCAVSYTLQTSLALTAAEEGASLLDLFLSPLVQELATEDRLTEESRRKLDILLKAAPGERIEELDIWLPDGTLVYSTREGHRIGEKAVEHQIRDARLGKETAALDTERPALQIYAPLYRTGTTEVIATSKVSNYSGRLAGDLRLIRLTSAAVVIVIAVPMMLALFVVARRASRAIGHHRDMLQAKVEEAIALAAQNERLRSVAVQARLDTIQYNERLLAQVGQDIHDGPIQLLTILGIKLSDVFDKKTARKSQERGNMQSGIGDLMAAALSELRNIATGMVLPQLEDLSTEEVLWLAVQQHESATGTTVVCEFGSLPDCSVLVRVCLYRFVQESLNNAYYHANGNGQRVAASVRDGAIKLEVSDSGSGLTEVVQQRSASGRSGLGLIGLRRRVEALSGSLNVISITDGTRVTAIIPVS